MVADSALKKIAVVGGGPAGLMAAQQLRASGFAVDLYEAMGSVGRKFLIAGKGGLNLTHSEPKDRFVARFRGREAEVGAWLRDFDAEALREFARGLGVETFVGSSGRVFPLDLKAAPMLRGWVRRLRQEGVRFFVGHRLIGVDGPGNLRFASDQGEVRCQADAVVLALGGGSWPQLGSTGEWPQWLGGEGVAIAPLRPSNCGFNVAFSAHLRSRFAGAPLKRVGIALAPDQEPVVGEFVLSDYGLEGSLVYALSAPIRDAIDQDGRTMIWLDLLPDQDLAALSAALGAPRGKRSIGEFLRRHAHLDAVRCALLFEFLPAADRSPAAMAQAIKRLPVPIESARPLAEAISSAGGVCFSSLDARLMLSARPGVFCAGEMIDWEAPTGGYLLTASFASGLIAARGAISWLAASG